MTCQTMSGPNKRQGGDCPWLCPWLGWCSLALGSEQSSSSEPPVPVGAVAVV